MENMDIRDDLHRRGVPASARRHDCNDGWLNMWLIKHVADYRWKPCLTGWVLRGSMLTVETPTERQALLRWRWSGTQAGTWCSRWKLGWVNIFVTSFFLVGFWKTVSLRHAMVQAWSSGVVLSSLGGGVHSIVFSSDRWSLITHWGWVFWNSV